MSQFILLETLATKRRGVPVYFETWTGIGPACTSDMESAQTFDSEDEARQHPAYFHSWSFFEPYPADEDEIWERLTRPGNKP